MSLFIDTNGRKMHVPADPNHFIFDGEVAEVFDDMAVASIPNYAEMHRLHCRMLEDRFFTKDITLFDIGASTGRWFRQIRQHMGVPSLADLNGVQFHAFDNSSAMLEKLAKELPEVQIHNLDLNAPGDFEGTADIVTMFYVLQFLTNPNKLRALEWVFDHMNPGSVLLLGQKEFFPDQDKEFQAEYIRFRRDNGYTKEEIDKKTKALASSMWCLHPSDLRDMLEAVGFKTLVETTRWLHFSTWMVYK